MEEPIDETMRLFSDDAQTTPKGKLGLKGAVETSDVLPTPKMTEMIDGRLRRDGVYVLMLGGLERSPKGRKRMEQLGKLYKEHEEFGPTLEESYLGHAEETDEGAREELLVNNVQGYKARHAANCPSTTDREDQHLPGDHNHRESDLADIAAPNPTSSMSIIIDHGSSKLTSTRHTTLETRVALENKWAAEDAAWTRLEERRRSQLQQKSLEHRQLMILRDSESKAAEDLRFPVNLRGQVDAAISEPSALRRLPEIGAPPGSSPTTIALYEQAREAAEQRIHSHVGQLHHADGGARLSKVRRELDESISKDEGRVEREKQKQFADRLMKARKPAEWKRVQAVRAAEAQREEEERARGRFQTWIQEDLVLPDPVQVRVKHRDVDWRASIDEQDEDSEESFESPTVSSLRTLESDETPLKNPFGSEESSDDDVFAPPSPSPKPRRLDPTAARRRDFNIGESPCEPTARSLRRIPVTPRGPQPFFGSFLFTRSLGRPRLSPEQILDKYEASLEEPETVVKKAKKWDLFAKPIPVLLPTNFGKFGRSSPSPDVPVTGSVEYKMTLPDVKMREGQTPDDVRMEREHLERYLTDNEIPFEYQKAVLEKRQAHAAVISRANLTGGRSPTRSPSRERARVIPTRTSSTRTASTNEKPVNKQLDTVRRLFTPNSKSSFILRTSYIDAYAQTVARSAVPTHIKSLLGRTPKVVVTSTTPPETTPLLPPTTARGFLSPTKTTTARARPVSSPTKLSSPRPRPSSYPNTGISLPPAPPARNVFPDQS